MAEEDECGIQSADVEMVDEIEAGGAPGMEPQINWDDLLGESDNDEVFCEDAPERDMPEWDPLQALQDPDEERDVEALTDVGDDARLFGPNITGVFMPSHEDGEFVIEMQMALIRGEKVETRYLLNALTLEKVPIDRGWDTLERVEPPNKRGRFFYRLTRRTQNEDGKMVRSWKWAQEFFKIVLVHVNVSAPPPVPEIRAHEAFKVALHDRNRPFVLVLSRENTDESVAKSSWVWKTLEEYLDDRDETVVSLDCGGGDSQEFIATTLRVSKSGARVFFPLHEVFVKAGFLKHKAKGATPAAKEKTHRSYARGWVNDKFEQIRNFLCDGSDKNKLGMKLPAGHIRKGEATNAKHGEKDAFDRCSISAHGLLGLCMRLSCPIVNSGQFLDAIKHSSNHGGYGSAKVLSQSCSHSWLYEVHKATSENML